MKRFRPKGLKYKITKPNPGWFKKGEGPWNKGMDGFVHEGSFKAGHEVLGGVETRFQRRGLAFKGTLAEYKELHYWVRKTLGDPLFCEKCGSNQSVQWANRSQKYKRHPLDWISLCVSCHFRYDRRGVYAQTA